MARPGGWTPGIVRARRVEAQFARQLRKIAYVVADIVRAFPEGDLLAWPEMQASLARYAEAILPWARAAAGTMLAEVDRRDFAAWADYSRDMKRALQDEIRSAPTGVAMRGLLADQVKLITSLPTEAGQRVHQWTLAGIADGTRATEVSRAIRATSDVTAARATMIARTEVSRTSTVLTQARAEHIGSTHFTWRKAHDSDVRPSHRALNGKVFLWSDPPVCDLPNHRALPGAIWNCRCYPEPILADF